MDQEAGFKSYAAVDEGISLWWRTIGATGGFVHHSGDIEWVMPERGGGPARIFNVRLAPETAEKRLVEIVAAMREGNLPGGMLLTPLSTPGNIAELLRQRGLSIDASEPCMVIDLAQFTVPESDPRICVSAVESEAELAAWAGIVNTGLFGCELFSLQQYRKMRAQENSRMYLASYDGAPASACMTINGGGVATLECVATLPEHRRKGLGSTVVSYALAALRDAGTGIVTLRSEPDGVGLYTRLGFKEICKRVVASV